MRSNGEGIERRCVIECNQHFTEESAETKAVIEFYMLHDRVGRCRLMNVHVVFLPGVDDTHDGCCDISATYDLDTNQIRDFSAYGVNVYESYLPELIQKCIGKLDGFDDRYLPFVRQLVHGRVFNEEFPELPYSNPN